MNVEATDGGGLRTSVQLVIKLDDVNDNRPQFISNLFTSAASSSASPPIQQTYSGSLRGVSGKNSQIMTSNEFGTIYHHTLIGFIEENTDKWFEPIRLQAFDRDLGLNGLIEYEIDESLTASEPFVNYFRINNVTKCVELKPNRTLDFEEIVKAKNGRNEIMLNNPLPGEVSIDLIVIARDFGRPSLTSKINARVIVKVIIFKIYFLNLRERERFL